MYCINATLVFNLVYIVFVYHADTLLTSPKTKQAVGGFRLLLVFTFYGLYFIILLVYIAIFFISMTLMVATLSSTVILRYDFV